MKVIESIRRLLSQKPGDPQTQRDTRSLFMGWFNNHMAVILMLIQRPGTRPVRVMMKIDFFLEDLEHHYIGSNATHDIHRSLGYLRDYFRHYPGVSGRQSLRALDRVGRIYEAVGLELKEPRRFARSTLRYGAGCWEESRHWLGRFSRLLSVAPAAG